MSLILFSTRFHPKISILLDRDVCHHVIDSVREHRRVVKRDFRGEPMREPVTDWMDPDPDLRQHIALSKTSSRAFHLVR